MVLSIFNSIFCAEPRKKAASNELLRTEEDIVPTIATKEKFLVLDLDLTLVHCKRLGNDTINNNGEPNTYRFSVTPRPYLQNFMEELSKHYTIVIYTSSSLTYALSVVKFLKISEYIKHLLHREHCIELNGQFVKDISMLNTPFSNTILIDDARSNYLAQPANCFPIVPFEGNKDDQHLLDLIPFLKNLSMMPDVRNVSNKHREYLDELSKSDSIGHAKFSALINAPLMTETRLEGKTSSESTATSASSDDEKSPRTARTTEAKELTRDSEVIFKVNKALKEQCIIRINKILRPYSSSKSKNTFW